MESKEFKNDRISDTELRQQVLEFRTTAELQPQIWTKNELIKDFEKLRNKNHATAVEKVLSGAMSVIDYTLDQSSAVRSLLEKAQDLIHDTAKEGLVETSTEIIFQPKNVSELKADQEFITKTASSVVLSVIPAIVTGTFPPLLAAGFVFSIVIYLHKREAEKEAKRDENLADDLWDHWVRVREKTQEKQNTKQVHKVEQTLMSNYSQDKQDSSKIGKSNVTMCDCVQLLNIIDIVGPSVFDAAAAFEEFKLSPRKISSLTADQKLKIKVFLEKLCADKIGKQKEFELKLKMQEDSKKDIKKSNDTFAEEESRKAGEQSDTKTLPPSLPVKGMNQTKPDNVKTPSKFQKAT
jgi:hypothetical protein